MPGDEISKIEYGKLIQMVTDMHDDVKEIKVDVKKQNGRVKTLESTTIKREEYTKDRRLITKILFGLVAAGGGGYGIMELFIK